MSLIRFYRMHNCLRVLAILIAVVFVMVSIARAHAHTFDVEFSLGIEVEHNNHRDREQQDRDAYERVERGEARGDTDYDRAERFSQEHIP